MSNSAHIMVMGPTGPTGPTGAAAQVGPDGICYSGTWVLGKQQGKGMLKDQNEGVIFFGQWQRGFPKLSNQ